MDHLTACRSFRNFYASLSFLWASLLAAGFASSSFAQEIAQPVSASTEQVPDAEVIDPDHPSHPSRLEALKQLKNVTRQDLKVNANAAQPEEVKDPLQPLNRQIYELNDALDRTIIRPVAVQYVEKDTY